MNNNKGRPVAHSAEAIEAFSTWFNGSKVTDTIGRPLVCYHGTDQDFHAFDKTAIGNNFRADTKGFFFTSNPKEASDYAENDTIGINKRENANVIPAYIRLLRPLVVDDQFLRKEGMAAIGVTEDTISFWDNYQALIHEWIVNCNADGVILVDNSYRPDGQPTKLIVALEPSQIKSAIGNYGYFSLMDPEITDRNSAPPAARLDAALSESDRNPGPRETKMRR